MNKLNMNPPPIITRTAHEIDYKIFGDDMQFVEVELDPMEAAIAEAKPGCVLMETVSNPLLRVGDIAAMTNLSKEVRARLVEHATLGRLGLDVEQVSRDGTRKLRLSTDDGANRTPVESTLASDAGWVFTQVEFPLGGIAPTANMRVRFVAADLANLQIGLAHVIGNRQFDPHGAVHRFERP